LHWPELAAAPAVAEALLPPAKAGYSGGKGKRGVMRVLAVVVAALALTAGSADAQTRKKEPPVMRSAAGTVIEPTKTIIHDGYGHTTVIVIPRRSYLETGTEVSVGDRGFKDYAFPPGGDPGRSNWFIGPDTGGHGAYPLPTFGYIPGFNPNSPF
jgi:hypothetical protein